MFLHLDLGWKKGSKVRIHLYTVPGQVFMFNRRAVLTGVDGMCFCGGISQETKSVDNTLKVFEDCKDLLYYEEKR
jgi:hypothetical protein